MTDLTFAPISAAQDLTEKLKAKGRARRKGFANAAPILSCGSALRNDLSPDLQLVDIAVGELKVSDRKFRKHSVEQLGAIRQSIATLGFSAPLLVGKNNLVVDGQARLEVACQFGLVTVPCIMIGHLSKAELRILRLAISRLSEKGEWDVKELKLELEELIILDAPISVTGFSSDEIDQIVLDDETLPFEKGPLEPDQAAVPVTRLGDVFQLGDHRLICGDATKPETYQALFEGRPEAKAQLIFTDEPYNVKISGHVSGGDHREFAMASGEISDAEFLAFNIAWIGAALPRLSDGGLLGTFIDWRGLNTVHSAATSFELVQLNLIVWAKTNAGMGSHYRSQHELLPFYKNGKALHINNIQLDKFGRYRSNLWTYPGASSLGSDARRGLKDHPTVKPTAMLVDALVDVTNRGDIVIDPFLGSDSTLIAAQKCGRVCYGIELDPLYVDLIIKRFEAETGQTVTLLATGETFAQLRANRPTAADLD
jgi:DNA modification methylase